MILDGLLEELRSMDVGTVKHETTLTELEALCRNPVFRMLCEICMVLDPPKARK